jgi:hypothetical protein
VIKVGLIDGLEVKATARILKYAEGADPKKDEPIGIEEKEYIFKGDEAIKVLKDNGISTEEALKLGIAKNKSNK